MQQDTPNKGEDIFKNKFGNFTPPPPNSNWQQIASQLEGEELDAFIKKHLNDIEPTPNPQIWENIKRKLPLSLLVRNQLNWLSRIAAVLIIFMVAVLLINKKDNQNTSSKKAIEVTEVNTPSLVENKNLDFVFAIENTNKREISASEELSLEDEITLENFWSVINDEQESFFAEVDEEIIKKSLQPILQLPIENLEAALPSNIRNIKPSNISSNNFNKSSREEILVD